MSWFAVGAAVVAAAGAVYQGQAASAQSKSQQNLSDYNAKVQENEAKALEQRTVIESQNQAKAAARKMSSMKAAMGGAGVISTEGAGLLALAEQGIESSRENQLIGYEGVTGIQRHHSQATLDRTQGKIHGQAASSAKTASYIKAGGSLLSGFSGGGTGIGKGSSFGKAGSMRSTEMARNFPSSAFKK